MTDDPAETSKGDEYRHGDGTREVVFAVAEGRVLTVKEYRDEGAFGEAVADATYVGANEAVLDLPDASAFDAADE